MTPADKLRMKHMLRAALGALAAAKGKSQRDLNLENDFTLALIKRIEMLGEAANRVTPATREEFSDIPWQLLAGTRNRLIHAYDEINLKIVWEIVTQDLPPLIARLERVLG